LGGFMSIIALTCFVLASIPRLLTKNPSSCPDGTPKTHLVGCTCATLLSSFSLLRLDLQANLG